MRAYRQREELISRSSWTEGDSIIGMAAGERAGGVIVGVAVGRGASGLENLRVLVG